MGILDTIKGLFDGRQLVSEEGKFKPGQSWHFLQQQNSIDYRLVILKCEILNEQSIVHIAIEKTGSPTDPFLIQHLPMTIASIESSVTTLQGTLAVLPDYTEGYQQWRTAFDKGQAGVWELAVCDVVESVLQFRQQF